MTNIPQLEMNNKLKIPQLGFGVFTISGDDKTEKWVTDALKLGIRHIDTAHIYGNERGVGRAVKKSGISREEIFITSKLWHNECGEGLTTQQIDKMLKRLDVSYIDLLLIHWPIGDYVGAWKDMEKAVSAGKVKSIGLSNFIGKYLEDILKIAKIKPVVDQVECHPYVTRNDLRKELNKIPCFIEAWSPLGRANKDLFKEEVLVNLGKKYNKTVAQVILRWHLDKGNIIFPTSTNPAHIKENMEIFDFKLTKEEIDKIDTLEKRPIFTSDFEAERARNLTFGVNLND